jgi:hypothetical protein
MPSTDDVIKRLIYQFSSTGADKVAADLGQVNAEQTKLAVSSQQTTRASLDLEQSFDKLERRFNTTIRAQQDYAKVQDQVNAAVKQHPELQERANSVLEQASAYFDRASSTTSAYAKATEAARGAALGLAAGIGPLGAVLGSFGPWGIAAAAGIGLVVNALNYMKENAEKLGGSADALKNFSENTGLTITQLRGLTEAGAQVGLSAEQVGSATEKFTANLAAARDGSGALYDALRRVDGGLADEVAASRSSAQAFDAVIKAINATTDATTKLNIAKVAFGKGGAGMAGVAGIVGDAGSINEFSAALEKASGVSSEMLSHVGALKNQLDALKKSNEDLKASFYSEDVLKGLVASAQSEHDALVAAKKAADDLKSGHYELQISAGNLFPVITMVKTSTEAATEATKADTTATQSNTAAQDANTAALTKKANQEAVNVGYLGSAATTYEKTQAKVDALTAAYNQGKMGAKDSAEAQSTLARSIQAVNDDAGKAEQAQKDLSNGVSHTTSAMDDATNSSYSLASGFNSVGSSATSAANAIQYYTEATKSAKASGPFAAPTNLAAPFAGGSGGDSSAVTPQGQAILAYNAQQQMPGGTGQIASWGTTGIVTMQGPRPGGGGNGELSADQMTMMEKMGFTPSVLSQLGFKLTTSLDDLTKSTNNLNATNQELLSPFYTQDPRTSHIGFRSQGMASGGYVTVPGGASANDNMLAMIPVASGERIYVDPMTGTRGGAGGGSIVLNISSPITINGNANADQFGRTVFQANQQLAKQIRTATQ